MIHLLSAEELDPEIQGDLRLVDCEDGDVADITVSAPASETTVTYQIAASADDAMAKTAVNNATATYVYFPDADTGYRGYMRWAINIPAGATVTDAYLSVCAYTPSTTTPTVRIELLDYDDCADF